MCIRDRCPRVTGGAWRASGHSDRSATPANLERTRSMKRLLSAALALLLVAVAASAASAETKLTTEVFTSSPQGFLVTSTLVAGEKEAVLIDGQLTLSDAHRLVGMILDSK